MPASSVAEEAVAPTSDPQQVGSQAVPEQPASDTYIQVTGPTNPIPNVLATASETVPGPAPVPAEPFTGSFAVFEDDEEEIDPEVTRREQRTTNSVLATLAVIVVVLLVAASYIIYRTIGIPFADEDRAAADTVPSASAQEAGGGGGQTQQPASTTPAQTPTQDTKPEIVNVSVVDEASSGFASSQAGTLTDGDTSKEWSSHYSASPETAPIDITLNLKSPAKVSQIEIQGTHEGGQIEVHASNANGPLLTHGPFASGTTTLPIDKPQDVDTIVVRITKLPMSPGADRPYRATATEITFK